MIYDEYGNLVRTIRKQQSDFHLPYCFYDTTSVKPKYPRNIQIKLAFDNFKTSLFHRSGLGIYRINGKYILVPLSKWGKFTKTTKFGYKTRLPDGVIVLMDEANQQWKIIGRNCVSQWVDGPVIRLKKTYTLSWHRHKNLKKQKEKKERYMKKTKTKTQWTE